MPSSSRWPNDPTTAWAQAVVDGDIVAGEFVRLAAERQLRDIRDGEKRGLYWRPEKAARALAFLPAVLSITEGAKAGKPFHPLPWHTFGIGSIFGWRTASDRMRWRSAWLETGKGQAKSPMMAAVGLYMMGWYGVPRAKVFAIGQDKNTANVLFKDSCRYCKNEDFRSNNKPLGPVACRSGAFYAKRDINQRKQSLTRSFRIIPALPCDMDATWSKHLTTLETADLLYGIPAIAAHLRLSKRTAYHLAANGTLPTFKIGGKVCARPSSLAAWLAEQERAATATAPKT